MAGHSGSFFLGLDDPLRCGRSTTFLLGSAQKPMRKTRAQRDAATSDRPAAQATWSAYCFHALSVIPLQILCQAYFFRLLRQPTEIFGHHASLRFNPSKGSAPRREWYRLAFCLLRFGRPPSPLVFHRCRRRFPLSNLPPQRSRKPGLVRPEDFAPPIRRVSGPPIFRKKCKAIGALLFLFQTQLPS